MKYNESNDKSEFIKEIGKNSKVFSIFDKYGTKTVKTIEDVVGLIGG